ncbi:MAG: hypothetical protein LBE91_19000 [Tannerella sp.]|jgi:hypothetical protein|nr:hypothetical protein [Tannerella sp.]
MKYLKLNVEPLDIDGATKQIIECLDIEHLGWDFSEVKSDGDAYGKIKICGMLLNGNIKADMDVTIVARAERIRGTVSLDRDVPDDPDAFEITGIKSVNIDDYNTGYDRKGYEYYDVELSALELNLLEKNILYRYQKLHNNTTCRISA